MRKIKGLSEAPRSGLTLLLLLTMAAMILVGGFFLARQEREARAWYVDTTKDSDADQRPQAIQYQAGSLQISITLLIAILMAAAVAILAVMLFLTQRRQEDLALRRVSLVNRVSHELRSPLTNIMLNIDLATELADEDSDELRRRLHHVRSEARRLGRLIDNVLAFSRTTSDKTPGPPIPCIPGEIISQMLESFATGFEQRGLTIKRTDENTDVPCLCVPDALAQILGNLLSNVAKYVPGGLVVVHTCVTGDELVMRVTDHGPGIPPEAAERIFNPFERVHSAINEGASGTGLGLSISRDLARQLGGNLVLLPAPHTTGASFELRIPAHGIS